jgi:hypothetical protein
MLSDKVLKYSLIPSSPPCHSLSLSVSFSRCSGLVFNEKYMDMLYVIQNGSLLRIDADFESFDVYEHYCLDMDEEEGVLTAIVCEFDEMLFRVNQAQAFIFATCMLISVPVSSLILRPRTKSFWPLAQWSAYTLAYTLRQK